MSFNMEQETIIDAVAEEVLVEETPIVEEVVETPVVEEETTPDTDSEVVA
jgi:hypothetical protein